MENGFLKSFQAFIDFILRIVAFFKGSNDATD